MKSLLIYLYLFSLSASVYSQNYEVRIVYKGGGVLGVEMRIVSGTPPKTTDYITDIVFGIKWNQTATVDFGNSIVSSFNMKKAGQKNTKGTYNYQAFYSDPIGFNFPAPWTAATWVEIMSISFTQSGSIAGIFQICEPGFDVTTNPNFGVNFTDFTPNISGNPIEAPLPVNISKFEADGRDSFIQLSWITETELNNKGFEIQRSQKEGSEFNTIGWVDGHGNTSMPVTYTFQDKKVSPGVKYYYRLKQVDLDNKETFTIIKWAELQSSGNALFRISPNPVDKTLQVFFQSSTISGPITWKIFTPSGTKVIEMNVTVNAGSRFDIPVSQLANGQYFLVASQTDKVLYRMAFQKL